jgi:hypothetical protein
MSWWLLLFAFVAIVITQNLVSGFAKGVIEMRAINVERREQPALFWFVVASETLILGLFLFGLVDWLLGGTWISEQLS